MAGFVTCAYATCRPLFWSYDLLSSRTALHSAEECLTSPEAHLLAARPLRGLRGGPNANSDELVLITDTKARVADALDAGGSGYSSYSLRSNAQHGGSLAWIQRYTCGCHVQRARARLRGHGSHAAPLQRPIPHPPSSACISHAPLLQRGLSCTTTRTRLAAPRRTAWRPSSCTSSGRRGLAASPTPGCWACGAGRRWWVPAAGCGKVPSFRAVGQSGGNCDGSCARPCHLPCASGILSLPLTCLSSCCPAGLTSPLQVLYLPADAPPYDPDLLVKLEPGHGTISASRSEWEVGGSSAVATALVEVLLPIQRGPLPPPLGPGSSDGVEGAAATEGAEEGAAAGVTGAGQSGEGAEGRAAGVPAGPMEADGPGARAAAGSGVEQMEGLETPAAAAAATAAPAAAAKDADGDAAMPGTPPPASVASVSAAPMEDDDAAPAQAADGDVILLGPPTEDAEAGPAVAPFNMWSAQVCV